MSPAERFLVTTLLLALAADLEGQAIRGSVLDERGTALAGVLVQLVSSRENVVARSLTDERGAYRVRGPAAGEYRVRTQRIGFRPLSYGPFSVRDGEDLIQDLTLTGLPVTLSTVIVAGQNPCRALGDSTASTYLAWEQARAALAAAEISGDRRGIIATTMVYDRILDRRNGDVVEQSFNVRSESVRQPWKSLSPDSLRTGGYVVREQDGSTTYHAPGLAVLLSDVFLEDHCFRLSPLSDSHRVGIDFEPTPGRRRLSDIKGTLWLDRRSSELRRLEFTFTNDPLSGRNVAGGELEFVRMSNGAWVIAGWLIRMPVLQQHPLPSSRPSGFQRSGVSVAAIKVSGGSLAVVRQGRDTLWSRPPLRLVGVVRDSVSGVPVRYARVRLIGTSHQGISDSLGRFIIPDVVPGAYTVEVRTPSLDSVSTAHRYSIALADSLTLADTRTPTARQVSRGLCRDAGGRPTSTSEGTGIISGSAKTPGDEVPAGGVRVVAEWIEQNPSERISDGAPPLRRREAQTDEQGSFRICGVPMNTPLTILARSESRSSSAVPVQVTADRPFARVSLTLDRSADGPAVFAGVVLSDSTLRPVASAEVALPELSRRVLTDGQGVFALAGIPSGRHRVVVRKIGYALVDMRITFVANRTIERRVILSPLTTLESVVVTAERDALPDFEAHRRIGLGHFLTRADLAKHGARRLSGVLTEVPGVRTITGASNRVWVTANRGRRSLSNIPKLDPVDMANGAEVTCYAQVYLDNHLVYAGKDHEPLFDINTIPVAQIEAIEYYSGPSQTPLKYGGLDSTCGVLVIHTRRDP